MDVARDPYGNLLYRPSREYAATLLKRGVRSVAGVWCVARYEHADPDAVDERI